jgi:hypothetical protein
MNQTEDFVFGTTGLAKLIKHEIQAGEPWRFEDKTVQMHQAEQNEFFKAIRGQRDRINNGDYMCRSTLMAILGREVCYTGREMTYAQIADSPQDLQPPKYEWGEAPNVTVPQPGIYQHPTA